MNSSTVTGDHYVSDGEKMAPREDNGMEWRANRTGSRRVHRAKLPSKQPDRSKSATEFQREVGREQVW